MKTVERFVMIAVGSMLLLISLAMWMIMPHWTAIGSGVCATVILGLGLFYPKF